jgi:arylsulfatase A-like enzyme
MSRPAPPSSGWPIRRYRMGSAIAALAMGALAVVGAACGGERSVRSAPDVVLILIDTLRPDHLGFYDYQRATAPYLASLARNGTVFEHANSTSSWTAPATASVFTGLYPISHGVTEGFFAHRDRMRELAETGAAVMPLNRLPADVPTIAEVFARARYRTYGAATNVNVGPHIGFDRGFDRFEYAHRATAGKLLERIEPWGAEMAASSKPTFLYLHLNDVHFPYERREPWYTARDDPLADEIAAYDSQIAYVDHYLAALGSAFGWDDRTLVAVVSDHGEEFDEHGGRRHRGGLYQELTHVLMMFRGPGVPVARISAEVSLVDVLPTLTELAGLPADASGDVARDGRSLAPLMRGGPGAAPFAGRTLLAHRAMENERFGQHWWAAIRGDWKLIVDPDGAQLYDHARDFFEHDDRAARNPERTSELRAELHALRTSAVRHGRVSASVPLDADLLQALEALGYVDQRSQAEPGGDGP